MGLELVVPTDHKRAGKDRSSAATDDSDSTHVAAPVVLIMNVRVG